MPYDWIVVRPGKDADAMADRSVDDLFWGIKENVLVGYVARLRGFPVMTITAVQHTADISQGQDPLAGRIVVDGFGLYRLFCDVNSLSVIECDKASITV